MSFIYLMQDNHAGCHHTSYCKRPNYTANKDILTDPQAIDAFSKKIKSLAIYRHADSYARVSMHYKH